jgi:hypothetical protein
MISRDGEYTSFLFPVACFLIAGFFSVIKFNVSNIQVWSSSLFVTLIQVLLFNTQSFRLHFFDQNILGFLILVILLFFFIQSTKMPDLRLLLTFVILILMTTQSKWEFDGDPTIYKTHEKIATNAKGQLPFFFFNKLDPGSANFQSLAASFTERAWWRTGQDFPNCNQINGGRFLDPNSYVVVFSRRDDVKTDVNKFLDCNPALTLKNQTKMQDSFGDFRLLEFITSSAPISISTSFAGESLPGLTGKSQLSSRIAREGIDKAGVLNFGPYVALPKGSYQVTYFYESTGDQSWDIVGSKGGKNIAISGGVLPSVVSGVSSFSTLFLVKNDGYRFEFRTFFNGKGQFILNRINLQQN